MGSGMQTSEFSQTPSPAQTRLTEFLLRENDLAKNGFDHWVFHPGMLFNSPDKWISDERFAWETIASRP